MSAGAARSATRELGDERAAVASKSHFNQATADYLEQAVGACGHVSVGSSLKFCIVAEGRADIYPRLSPTSEWDTAAGHAVLLAAGGRVDGPDGAPLRYGKTAFLNRGFCATGGWAGARDRPVPGASSAAAATCPRASSDSRRRPRPEDPVRFGSNSVPDRSASPLPRRSSTSICGDRGAVERSAGIATASASPPSVGGQALRLVERVGELGQPAGAARSARGGLTGTRITLRHRLVADGELPIG